MNRENEKAMFAKLGIQRIKNLPSLDKEHFLVEPKNAENTLLFRNAQKLSAKTSEQRNKAFLRQQQYDKSWKDDIFYLSDPKYQELENKISKLRNMNLKLIENDQVGSEEFNRNKKLVDELDNERKAIKEKYYDNYEKLKKTRKSSAISFSGLHRHAYQNQRDLENIVSNKDWFDLDYDVRKKLLKSKPKGFNDKLTPNYKSDMSWKLYSEEDKEVKPIEDEIKKYDNKIQFAEKDYRDSKYMNKSESEIDLEFNKLQKLRQEQLDLMQKRSAIRDKFIRIQDSVHGHVPKFKR